MAKRRVARIVGLGVLGVVAGLGVSELVFRQRDGGAFPQLNVFVADVALGVRLRPGATETVRFGGPKNPATSVRIGTHGYRGEARPPASDEIIVVGDLRRGARKESRPPRDQPRRTHVPSTPPSSKRRSPPATRRPSCGP